MLFNEGWHYTLLYGLLYEDEQLDNKWEGEKFMSLKWNEVILDFWNLKEKLLEEICGVDVLNQPEWNEGNVYWSVGQNKPISMSENKKETPQSKKLLLRHNMKFWMIKRKTYRTEIWIQMVSVTFSWTDHVVN